MNIFDLYRKGYQLGSEAAQQGARRRSLLELRLLYPSTWIPGVDAETFVNGYREGYSDGMAARQLQQALDHPLNF
ncbi:hypothetical protein AGMMS50256_17400 [Betaproteobacteria bacterium]|nr:hypothetical protein AGMMS50256_17400 [Betaproteobacteria bacterium]